MARRKIKDVVTISEGNHKQIGMMLASSASEFLVARLFTDAVFSDDVRAIQLIINRIDGGLPKDVDVESYKTEFGDTLNNVLQMTKSELVKVHPDDTVMLALCKNLYLMAVQDIYWDYERQRPKRPSEASKKERDSALRIILERTGGRKTLTDIPPEIIDVEVAPWIAGLIPEKKSEK